MLCEVLMTLTKRAMEEGSEIFNFLVDKKKNLKAHILEVRLLHYIVI